MESANSSKYSVIKYALRQFVPDNLDIAKQNHAAQLQAFKDAQAKTTQERVSSNGFILQSSLKIEKITE